MYYLRGVFNTDQVNRQNIVFPVDVLAGGLVDHFVTAKHRGLPPGTETVAAHSFGVGVTAMMLAPTRATPAVAWGRRAYCIAGSFLNTTAVMDVT